MNELKIIVENHSLADSRSAFYYLGRYLKQASFYDEYKKDIFEDDLESSPSKVIKQLTLKLIEFIEVSQKKKSSIFTDDEFILWMDRIDVVESELDPEPTETIVDMAEKMIQDLEPLKVNDTNESHS